MTPFNRVVQRARASAVLSALIAILLLAAPTFVVGAGPVLAQEPPTVSPSDFSVNARSWTKGQTLTVYVDSAGAPAGYSAEVDAAIAAWNAAKPAGAFTLVRDDTDKTKTDIHISWTADGSSWGRTLLKDEVDKNSGAGFTKPTVRMEIESNDGLNADGLRWVLMHELGHAMGIGHLPGSKLMHGRGQTAAQVNAAGVSVTPGAHEKAVLKNLPLGEPKGNREGKSGQRGGSKREKDASKTHHLMVTAHTMCDAGACSSGANLVVVEVPEAVLLDVQMSAPAGWTAEAVSGISANGKPADSVGPTSAALVFSGGPLTPGDCVLFAFTTLTQVAGANTHLVTTSADADEGPVAFSEGELSCEPSVPGLTPGAVATAALLLVTAGMVMRRQPGLSARGR